jgi:hypothetical protein
VLRLVDFSPCNSLQVISHIDDAPVPPNLESLGAALRGSVGTSVRYAPCMHSMRTQCYIFSLFTGSKSFAPSLLYLLTLSELRSVLDISNSLMISRENVSGQIWVDLWSIFQIFLSMFLEEKSSKWKWTKNCFDLDFGTYSEARIIDMLDGCLWLPRQHSQKHAGWIFTDTNAFM